MDSADVFTCLACGQDFENQNVLVMHMVADHTVKKPNPSTPTPGPSTVTRKRKNIVKESFILAAESADDSDVSNVPTDDDSPEIVETPSRRSSRAAVLNRKDFAFKTSRNQPTATKPEPASSPEPVDSEPEPEPENSAPESDQPPAKKRKRAPTIKVALADRKPEAEQMAVVTVNGKKRQLSLLKISGKWQCQICTQRLNRPITLQRHYLKEHEAELAETIEPGVEGAMREEELAESEPGTQVTNDDETEIKTEFDFPSSPPTRSADGKFTCKECGKKFGKAHCLVRHRKETHEAVRKFKCRQCDFSFVRKDHLRRHQQAKRHTDNGDDIYVSDSAEPEPKPSSRTSPIKTPRSAKPKRISVVEPKKTKAPVIKTPKKKSIKPMKKKSKIPPIEQQDLKQKVSEGPFRCKICKEQLENMAAVKDHVSKHSKNLLCLVCELRQKTAPRLEAHVMRHMALKIFHCILCTKAYVFEKDLRGHAMFAHAGKNACGMCGAKLEDADSLREHFDTAHRTKQQDLTERKLERSRETRLAETLKAETIQILDDEGNICQMEFYDATLLEEKPRSVVAIECRVCDKEFKTETERYRHMTRVHPNELGKQVSDRMDKKHPCTLCERRFGQPSALYRHYKSDHFGFRPLQCQCGELFASKPLLDGHRRREGHVNFQQIEMYAYDAGKHLCEWQKWRKGYIPVKAPIAVAEKVTDSACTGSAEASEGECTGSAEAVEGEFTGSKEAVEGGFTGRVEAVEGQDAEVLVMTFEEHATSETPSTCTSTNQAEGDRDKADSSEADSALLTILDDFECSCGKRFGEKSLLKDHIEDYHMNIKNYRCGCGEEFYAMGQVKAHLKSAGHAYMTLERYSKEAVDDMRRAVAGLDPVSPVLETVKLVSFMCDECGQVLHGEAALRAHKRMHAQGKGFGKKINTENNRTSGYRCQTCKALHYSKESLEVHQKVHLNPFPCGICYESLASLEELRQHYVSMHSDVGKPQHTCQICWRQFNTCAARQSHTVTHGEKAHICDVCHKGFHAKAALQRHYDIVHLNNKPFDCEVCGKKFARKYQCKAHLLAKHSKVKAYQCEFCDYKAKFQASLYIHEEKVHGKIRIRRPRPTAVHPSQEAPRNPPRGRNIKKDPSKPVSKKKRYRPPKMRKIQLDELTALIKNQAPEEEIKAAFTGPATLPPPPPRPRPPRAPGPASKRKPTPLKPRDPLSTIIPKDGLTFTISTAASLTPESVDIPEGVAISMDSFAPDQQIIYQCSECLAFFETFPMLQNHCRINHQMIVDLQL